MKTYVTKPAEVERKWSVIAAENLVLGRMAVEIDARGRSYATGKRKNAAAKVRFKRGVGRVIVNGRSVEEYFTRGTWRLILNRPFHAADRIDHYDVICTVRGGALRHGISKALTLYELPCTGRSRRAASSPVTRGSSSARYTASARRGAASSSPGADHAIAISSLLGRSPVLICQPSKARSNGQVDTTPIRSIRALIATWAPGLTWLAGAVRRPSESTGTLVKKLMGCGITEISQPSWRMAVCRLSTQLARGPPVAEELVAKLVAGGEQHIMHTTRAVLGHGQHRPAEPRDKDVAGPRFQRDGAHPAMRRRQPFVHARRVVGEEVRSLDFLGCADRDRLRLGHANGPSLAARNHDPLHRNLPCHREACAGHDETSRTGQEKLAGKLFSSASAGCARTIRAS